MDHDLIAYLRMHSRAWRLVRADTAPLVLAVLGQIFVVDNVRSIAESGLVARVDRPVPPVDAAQPVFVPQRAQRRLVRARLRVDVDRPVGAVRARRVDGRVGPGGVAELGEDDRPVHVIAELP